MRVYYHCDDAGATPAITRRILHGWELGWLDGFSVFANSDHLEGIQKRLNVTPERALRLGVHLNLTEGPALADSTLADSQGRLEASFVSLAWQPPDEADVLREWRAQIETVRAALAPRPISVLDSHNHVHMLPRLFPLACRLACEFGVPEIRLVHEPFHLCRECLHLRFPANLLKRAVMELCRPAAQAALDRLSVRSPERTLGVLFSGLMTCSSIRAGLAAARHERCDTVEVITHVGRAEARELSRWDGSARRAAFFLSPMRDREWEGLRRAREG